MADKVISEEIVALLSELGKKIKESEAYKEYSASLDTYTRSEELNRMVFEYNVHQQAIAEEYKKEDKDDAMIESITKRIDELYQLILSHPDYRAFLGAQGDYENYMKSVYAELDYQITGKRACSHDCSSCSGCSSSSAE